MSILSGFLKTKKYRKKDDGNYQLQSEWTSSETVEMADGNTLETNLGSIKGITSSLSSTSSNYALSASAGKSLQDNINTLNTNLTNLSTEFTSDKAALATHKNSSDHDSRYYTKTQNDTLLNAKQDSLIFDTYVNTETANSNGSITLGIDISGYKLSQKPKCAFLQGQHVSFENYIFSYDNSTSTLAIFVVNYGTSYANTPITNRYGVMIIK